MAIITNHILVVDSDAKNLQQINTWLASPNCKLKLVSTIEQSTELVSKQGYDLILIDADMAGNGFLPRLHQTTHNQHSIILVMTTAEQLDRLRLTPNDSFLDYLIRPLHEVAVKSRIQAALRVVTERKRAEETLSRYEFIVNASDEFMSLINRQHIYEAVNDSFILARGITRADAIGKTLKEMWGKTIYEKSICPALERCFQGEVVTYEERFAFKNRAESDYRVTYYPYRSPGGEITHSVVVTVDIRELKAARHVLQEMNTSLDAEVKARTSELLRVNATLHEARRIQAALLDSIPDMAWLKDKSGTFIAVNQAFADASGLSSEELVGKCDLDIWPADLAHKYMNDDQSVLQACKTMRFEERLVDKNGREMWVEAIKVPALNGNQVIGIAGISRDITERRDNEFMMRQAHAHLEDLVKQRTAELTKANESLTAWVQVLEQRNHEIAMLNEMGDLLQSCFNAQDAYDVLAQYAGRLFQNHPGMLYMMRNSRNYLEPAVSWGSPVPEEVEFSPRDCWALRRGRSHVISSQNRLRCQHLSGWDEDTPYLCVPLVAQGETMGVLHLREVKEHILSPSGAEEEQKKMEEWEPLATMVAERAALALANLKLRESLRHQSVRDPLTGLYNRRYMEETLERDLRRSARHNLLLWVLMADIDHFKAFNDSCGHETGDEMLRQLGAYLRANLRGEDIACRYGGEEFLIIMPDISQEDVLGRAEQIRQGIRSINIHNNGINTARIHLSIGIAAYPLHADTFEELLRAADVALYRAKREGRDRVAIAENGQKN